MRETRIKREEKKVVGVFIGEKNKKEKKGLLEVLYKRNKTKWERKRFVKGFYICETKPNGRKKDLLEIIM